MIRSRRWAAVSAAVVLGLALTGCAGMNEQDVSDRLVEATSLNGAIVEVQHPGAPWVNQIMIRMFVEDGSADAVAEDVREVAAFAVEDSDLEGEPLMFLAVEGSPDDFDDPVLATIVGSLRVMGSVSEALGAGHGVEEILELSANDVRVVAAG